MDFTPLYPHSSSSSSTVSPDGQYLLTAVGERLVVRSTESMDVLRSWKCELSSSSDPSSSLTEAASAQSASGPGNSQDRKPSTLRSNTRSVSATLRARDTNVGIPTLRASNSNTHLGQPTLTCISFSPDSHSVLALLRHPTTSLIYVYSIPSDGLIAKIQVGAEGVANGEKAVRWSPNGDALIVWSDWNLRVTIWPLKSNQSRPVQLHHPKHGPNLGSTFSPTGRYLALLCRQPANPRHQIGVYDTVNWTCVSLFEVSTEMMDVSHLVWSPCGRYLAATESALFDYRIEIWSPTGSKLGVYTPYHHHTDVSATSFLPEASHGRKTASKIGASPQDLNSEHVPDGYVGLGVRCIRWRPRGEYLAIGGWDSRLRVLNDLTWTLICEVDLAGHHDARVLNEPRDWIERTRGQGLIPFDTATSTSLPHPLRPDFSKPNPSIGIKDIQWSSNGDYLACRNDSMPAIVYIISFLAYNQMAHSTDSQDPFSFTTATPSSIPLRPRVVSILNFAGSVKSMEWHPDEDHLAVTCSTSALYMWYPVPPGTTLTEGTEVKGYTEGIGIPARVTFTPQVVNWIQQGRFLILSDKLAFCLAFPVSEDVDGNQREDSMMMEMNSRDF